MKPLNPAAAATLRKLVAVVGVTGAALLVSGVLFGGQDKELAAKAATDSPGGAFGSPNDLGGDDDSMFKDTEMRNAQYKEDDSFDAKGDAKGAPGMAKDAPKGPASQAKPGLSPDSKSDLKPAAKAPAAKKPAPKRMAAHKKAKAGKGKKAKGKKAKAHGKGKRKTAAKHKKKKAPKTQTAST